MHTLIFLPVVCVVVNILKKNLLTRKNLFTGMLIAVYKGLVKISVGRNDCGFLNVYKIKFNKKQTNQYFCRYLSFEIVALKLQSYKLIINLLEGSRGVVIIQLLSLEMKLNTQSTIHQS